jgi:hypothetical protein
VSNPQYVLTVQVPTLRKGAAVQVPGLGEFENGYEYTLTDEQVDSFRTYNHAFDDEGNFVLGPTPLQANLPLGLEVSTKKDVKTEEVK